VFGLTPKLLRRVVHQAVEGHEVGDAPLHTGGSAKSLSVTEAQTDARRCDCL